MSVTSRWKAASLWSLLTAGVLAAATARADDNPWAVGSNWMVLRAGYAHSGADGAGEGGGGYGVGPFFRKLYNTGDDFSRVRTSGFIATGFDAPVASHQMLGFDIRMARVMSENKPENPVFGAGQLEASHWSMKLTYAIAY